MATFGSGWERYTCTYMKNKSRKHNVVMISNPSKDGKHGCSAFSTYSKFGNQRPVPSQGTHRCKKVGDCVSLIPRPPSQLFYVAH